MPIDPVLARGADLLVHDATFLGVEERRQSIHATTEEVFALARQAGVAALVLNHLSVRYDRAVAVPRINEQLAASGFDGECWLLDEDRFLRLDGGV
jgi:ribonuclease BN (tRNA processing enzyme)